MEFYCWRKSINHQIIFYIDGESYYDDEEKNYYYYNNNSNDYTIMKYMLSEKIKFCQFLEQNDLLKPGIDCMSYVIR